MGDGMYLMLNPESASLVSPTVNGNVIQTNVGLRARPQIILGSQPAPGTAPLPDAGAPDGGNAFNVSLPVKATYAFVDAQIRKALDLGHGGAATPLPASDA